MRALLKDVGIGNMVLRTALVEIAFMVLDASGDGRVSEKELRVALGIATCVLGDYFNPDSSKDTILTPIHRLASVLDAAFNKSKSFDAFVSLMNTEVHSRCQAELQAWWAAGWLERLSVMERASPLVQTDLASAHNDSPAACADMVARRLLGDATAVRTGLKQLGVQSVLARHIAAKGLIKALDEDGDKKLSAAELMPDALRLCRGYCTIAARQTTAAHLFRAVSLVNGYPLTGAFLDDLRASTASELAEARAVATDEATASAIEPDGAVALIDAYARLVPDKLLDAHPTGKEEL